MNRTTLPPTIALWTSVICIAIAVAAACADDRVPRPRASAPTVATVDAVPVAAAVTGGAANGAPPARKAEPLAPRVPTLPQKEALVIPAGDLVDPRAEGEELLRRGQAREAIGALRKALSVDASVDVWAALGDAYVRAGEVERGVRCWEEAVALDVDHVAARRALARHFLSRDDGARARAHAEEWVRLRPQDPAARQALGRAFSQMGMWQEAIEQFTLVVEVQPDNVFAHNNLGFAALQLGDDGLAIRHLERVLSLKPQQGYMLNNLGVAYERAGRIAEAHAAFARAVELSPRYAQAALNRDRVQRRLDQGQRIVAASALLAMREGVVDSVARHGAGPDGGTADGDPGLDVPATPSFAGP